MVKERLAMHRNTHQGLNPDIWIEQQVGGRARIIIRLPDLAANAKYRPKVANNEYY